MPRSSHLYSAVVLICAVYIGLKGYLGPINNWDLIGYIASSFSYSGLSGAALHDATFAELRRAIPAEHFDRLTIDTGYRLAVSSDPEALGQQLPFYSIRVLYIYLIKAVGLVTSNLAQATHLISATAAAGLAMLSGLLFWRSTIPAPWFVLAAGFLLILHFNFVVLLARLSTPDALYALLALGAVALFYRVRTAAFVIVAFLPLVRTDAVILSALFLVLLLVERDRDPRHYLALVISGALYLWTNAAHGNYGHAVVFNFSLIPSQRTAYPAELEILRDVGVYLDVYARQITALLSRPTPWILLLAGAGVALEKARTGAISPNGRIALICITYVTLHFLTFPLGHVRHYAFALLFCSIFIAGSAIRMFMKTDG